MKEKANANQTSLNLLSRSINWAKTNETECIAESSFLH